MKGRPQEGWITANQRDVWLRTALGHPSKRMAEELGVSLGTIDKHRNALHRALKCTGSAALTFKAVEYGLVVPTPRKMVETTFRKRRRFLLL